MIRRTLNGWHCLPALAGLSLCMPVWAQDTMSDFNLRLTPDGSSVVFVPNHLNADALAETEALTAVPIVDGALSKLGFGVYALTESNAKTDAAGLAVGADAGGFHFDVGAVSEAVSLTPSTVTPAGCGVGEGVLGVGGVLSNLCQNANDAALPGRIDSAFVGVQRSGAQSAQSFFVGVSQVNPVQRIVDAPFIGADAWAPVRPVQPQLPLSTNSTTVKSAGGSAAWVLAPDTVLKLSAQYERSKDPLPQLQPGLGGNTRAGALGINLTRGSLSGSVVGRVLDRNATLDQPAQNSQALDLGVTWKTPWRGALSVGAQNVITRQKNEAASKPDPALERTPYVQYEQDL